MIGRAAGARLASRLARNARSVGGQCHGARRIDNIDDARPSWKVAALGRIGHGTVLVEADLMVVRGALAGNGARLPVHLLAKVEQITY